MNAPTVRHLFDESPTSRCLSLIARCAPRMMKAGGGALSQEMDESHANPVSPKEARRFLKMAQSGMSSRKIAREVGRTQPCVIKHLRRLGFATPWFADATKRRTAILKLKHAGKGATEIAQACGMRVSRVHAVLCKSSEAKATA